MIALYAFLMSGMAPVPIPPQLASEPPAGSDVAECVVDNDLWEVRKLLDTVPGSQAEARAARGVLVYYGGCSDNRIAIGNLAWRERAEIAYAALQNRLGKGAVDTASPPPRARWALLSTDGNQRLVAVRQFGDCVVDLAPAKALRLIQSPAGSRDEAAAIDALRPSLDDCLAPRQNFTVKRGDLRLILAEPLYHMLSK